MIYDVIVVGAGASGLFFSSALKVEDQMNSSTRAGADTSRKFRGLILEKGKRPGRKLLMSGSGQCNITHAGSIKDFIGCYGSHPESVQNVEGAGRKAGSKSPDTGRLIRSCLYKYNNISLIDFLETGGVKTAIREDGKVFPASMDSRDVLDLLLRRAKANGFEIRYECPVEQVMRAMGTAQADREAQGPEGSIVGRASHADQMIMSHDTIPNAAPVARWQITAAGETFLTRNLVIAAGGCSYPTTGSDGSMFRILGQDLGIGITPLKPSLSALHVEGYPYRALSGISFDPVQVTIRRGTSVDQKSGGDRKKYEGGNTNICQASAAAPIIAKRTDAVLFTHRDLSGPAILNLSKFAEPGDTITINYVYPLGYEQVLEKLKAAAHGAKGSLAGILSSEFRLPLRFCRSLTERYGNSLKLLARVLTGEAFHVSSVTGFDKAMATSGGIALSEMNMRTMECKTHPGLYAIGEALDVDGITGGYNLQFAYSSARMAAEAITSALNAAG